MYVPPVGDSILCGGLSSMGTLCAGACWKQEIILLLDRTHYTELPMFAFLH